jgi:predicted metal-dependent hydrolase
MSDIEVVRHARARRYVIRVRPDGTVRVSVPRWGSKREALAFCERERAWIEKERQRVAEEQALARRLAPPPEVERALRAKAARELPARVAQLAAEHGLLVSRTSVRNQRWRWGSCSRAGHICLNWRLIAMPEWVRDYVILHELMHLKRLDHSPRFWKLVAAACPEYEEARAWLRRHAARPESLHYN